MAKRAQAVAAPRRTSPRKATGKFRWQAKRTGVGQEVSELAMAKDAKSRLRLSTLLKVSKNSEAKRKMRNFEEKAVMDAPLKKPLAQKAARRVNFEAVSAEITKYDPIVRELRSAEQVIFPRNEDGDGGRLRLTVAGQFGSSSAAEVQDEHQKPNKAKKLSSLEREINEQLVLNEENVELDARPLTENELAILRSKSVEEARALHREIQRRRLLTSYQEAKFRRLRRIKSKKYHRILKKEKLKATVAELDQLIENGEEGVEEKLAELDRLRALERASLKHHATGKWAKYSKLRSKYDDTARAQLNEQMALNAELMKRRSLAVLDEFGRGKKIEEGDEDVERLVMGSGGGGSLKKVAGGEEFENELPLSIPTDYNPWISKVPKGGPGPKPPPIPTKDEENSSERFFARRIRARMAAQEAEERREARRQDAQDEEAILVESSAFSSSPALSTALSTTTNRAPDGDDPNTFTTTKNLKQQKSKRGGQQHENSEDASDAESSEEAESSSSSSTRQKTTTKNLKLDSLIVSAEEVRTKRGKLVNNVPTDGNDDDQEDQGEHDEVGGGGQTMGDFDFSGADMQRYLREAFLDDDVVADFLKEKKEEEEGKAENPDKNSVSAYLPGWGNWAGGGIAENRRKRARLVKRTAGLAKPVGASWNPQSVFRSMTAPKVLTKAGAIIRPMAPAPAATTTVEGALLKGKQHQKERQQKSRRKALR
ncbi:U3 small nucleolar RNA-associated protein 14 A [Tyrophagus putrescentiae]|nr:U3 small nucleolar RNA-associated protein 14 A [Tyrophagus putrescentiae]